MSFLTGLRLRELNSWKISPMFLVGFVFCFVFSFKHCYCCWHFRTPKARTRDSCSSCRKSLSKCNRAGGNLEDHSVHAHTPRQITHTHVYYFSQTHLTFPEAFQKQRFDSLLRQSVPWQLSYTSWAERMIIPFSAAAAFEHLRPLSCLPLAISSG